MTRHVIRTYQGNESASTSPWTPGTGHGQNAAAGPAPAS
jgi:hypothetical protein